MAERVLIRTIEDAEAVLNSLIVNDQQQADRIRTLEKLHDVQESPWWKLALFALDGWPLRRVVARPQWRPWRRWWTS